MVVPVDSGNGVRKYVWDNVTTDFSYPYIIESESLFANLYNDNGELVLSIPSTAYTLSDPTRSAGVLTITNSDVLETEADSIILERIEELNQELDLGKRDFPPQDIEDAFDKSRIIDQQQQALTNRGVITNITENRQEPIELPPAVQDLFLAWDEEGNLKNATSTGTPLPTVPNTYLKRNNDNTAFDTLTSSEVLTDIGAQGELIITDGSYIKGTGIGFEEVTKNELKSELGLPIDYIKDDIQYVSASQVSWQGSCRDSSNTRDLILGSATTASLVSPTGDTTYNLFVAANTLVDTPVVVWDTGSTPVGYTYYRRVLSIITDGIGNILEPKKISSIGKSLYYEYNTSVTDYNQNGNYDSTVDLTVPTVKNIRLMLYIENLADSAAAGGAAFINNKKVIEVLDSTSSSRSQACNSLSNIITDNAQINLLVSDNPLRNMTLNTDGYIDERE